MFLTNPYFYAAPSTLLLDLYPGAAAAYSVRKLNSTYSGNCIRVRRSSNNAETDIGFVNNQLDTVTLLNFVNAENYLTYSQDFTQAASWTKTAVTVTAAAGIAPDGTTTAQKCVPSAAVTTKAVYQVLPSVSTRDYVFSMYAKAAEYNYMQLLAIRDSTNRYSIIVDLTTGAITQSNSVGTPNFVNSSVTSVGNGWYRIVITLNINLGTNYFVFSPSPVSNPTLNASLDLQSAGNGTSGVLFWGAQLNYFLLKSYSVTTNAALIPTTTNGFVTTWYDQSGNNRNLIQATALSQPRIVNAGVMELSNGKSAIYFNGFFMAINTIVSTSTQLSLFEVFKINDALNFVINTINGGYNLAGSAGSGSGSDSMTITSRYKNSILTSTTTQSQVNSVYNTNAQTLSTQFFPIGFSDFGIANFSAWPVTGFYQEVIVYTSSQSANRNEIESNINSYYNIYWQGTGTALLDTYSGAAAAYSLRNLSSTYFGPLVRVRRSSDNVEQNFYGLYNGQLDTSTLLTFVGAGNGYVTTWYDQSGSSNNAAQATAQQQPLIVSNGVLITENTKPSVSFLAQGLTLTTGISSNSNLSIFFTQRSKSVSDCGALFGHNSGGGSGPNFGAWNDNKFFTSFQINAVSQYAINTGSTIGTTLSILNTVVTNSTFSTYVNNISYPLTANTWTPSTTIFTQIGRYFNFYSNANISELIVYKTDQTANNTPIKTNINSYYNIY